MKSWRRFSTAQIYETLLSMHEQGELIGYEALNARLDQRHQELLASIVLSKEEAPQPSAEDALSCLTSMQRHEREHETAAIRDEIKAAEREGRMQDALNLMKKLREQANSRPELRL